MALVYDKISSLNPIRDNWNVLARVIRLWSTRGGVQITGIDFILMDDQGSRIQATVRKHLAPKYEKLIREGAVYAIRNFTIANNIGCFRVANHEYKITIQVDVIGMLSRVGEQRNFGGGKKMKQIVLDNFGVELTCSFWGHYNDEIDQFLTANSPTNAIVVIMCGKIKEFQDRRTIQNGLHCCKILFNPTFHVALEFKNKMLLSIPNPQQGVGRIVDASQVSLEDDFLNFHERKTLAELKDPAIDADKCYIVEATIKYLLDPQGWWYNVCSCNKPVQPDSVSYYCGPCDRRVVNVQTRYRIRIKVIDETDSTIFVIFDRPASILLKRPCSDLIASCEKTAAGVTCPVEIMNLLDGRLLFKVEIKKDSDGRFEPSYTVKRATDHGEILAKFRVAAPPKDNDTSVQSASLSKCSMRSDSLVPPTIWDFVKYDDVLSGALDESLLVDVIGMLSRVGEQRSFGGGKKMKHIVLDNFGVELTCSFWGHYIDEIDQFLTANGPTNAIVVIMCGKIKEFQGRRTIQNGLHCSKILFNPTFHVALEFKNKMLLSIPNPQQGVGRIVDASQVSLEDDFLNFHERKTLAELKDPAIDADKCYIVEATIKYLLDPQGWWYNVCSCNKPVQPDSVSYYCGPCDRRVVNVQTRYRIRIKVIDETDSTIFVIFDRPASILLKRPCSDLIASCEKTAAGVTCPVEIMNLLDGRLLFKVEIKKDSDGRFEPSYTVKRATDHGEILAKFRVAAPPKDNDTSVQVANHEYKITIQGETIALLQSDSLVPPTIWDFVKYDDVLSGALDESLLVDVIGMLSRVGKQRSFGGGKKMKHIVLDNFGVELTCSFWGHYIDEIDQFLTANGPTNAIVVIMCGKIKEFQGRRTIHNGLHCSKILFNPTFHVALEFKNKMLLSIPNPQQGVGRIVDASQVSLEDDFLNFHERKTLAELKDPAIDADKCYIVEATIKYLLDPQGWWYNVCSCNKPVQPDSVSYYCGPYDRRVVNVQTRYRIRIKVIDETDSTIFVIFDRPASILLKRPCSDLIASCEKTAAGVTCPVEIMNLLDGRLLFKVEIKKDSDGRFEPSYTVKRATDHGEILAKFRVAAPPKDNDTSVQGLKVLIREGAVYAIRNFTLANNTGGFRVANHEYKITIQGETIALLQSDSLVPPTIWDFVKYDDVLSGALDESLLVDVIGIVELTCSFWGHYIDEIDQFLTANGPTNAIVVIMCGKIKEFQGRRTIQNGLHCCKILFNPTFHVALEFKNKMLLSIPNPQQGVGRIVYASQVSLEDDFLNFHERKTLAELKDPAIDADKCYIVEATIKYLLDPQGWWYNVCSCNKPVQPDSVSYYCGPCDRRVVNVQTRYRIRIKVIDETDSTIFVIFDRPASILLKRPCSDLIASCEKTAAGVTCPVEIMNLLDGRLPFKVEIKKDSDGRFEPSYTVKRATDHGEILAKFRVAAPPKDNDTSGFEIANHEYKITIQGETIALLQSDSLVPPTIWDFVKYDDVLSGVLDESLLVDVIGMLSRVGEQRSFGGGKKMKHIVLDNFGVELTCSFWGHYIDEIDQFLTANGPTNAIVVIMCGKIKEFQGRRTIQNGLHCCKILFNPTFHVALEFKNKMLLSIPNPQQGVGRIVDASQVSLEDDFLNFHERKTLAELKDPAIDVDKCYIVEATIKYLLDPQGWWYNVCSCNKPVQPDSVSYYCGPCDRRVVNVQTRYRIRIKVIDETDSTIFVIFDRPASILLKRPCSDLIASCEKTAAGVTCPVEIMNLLDGRLPFKVEIKKDSDGRFEPSYTVKRATDHGEILAKFRVAAPPKDNDTSVQNFTLANNTGGFRVANHEYKITIQGETIALLQSDSLVPPTIWDFVKYDDVLSGVLDESLLVDVIGMLSRVGEQRSFGGGKKMKHIVLDNFGVELTCSFWGHYIDEIDQFLTANGPTNAIVVIMCGKIKEFQGRRTIQNGLHCCKILFNPTFHVALEFKNKMLLSIPNPQQGVGRIVDASQVSLEDDFLNFHERKTLAELKDPAIDADKCYIVEATIKYLLDPQGWWYNVCSCNKPVQPDSVSYYCGPCDRRVVNVQTRYRIRIKVIDETDSTIFVIFDRPASILLKRPCSDLIASCEKTAAGVTCPVEIMNLLDGRLLFKVEIKKDSDGRFEPSYTVKRATDHGEILAKFRVAAPPKDNDTSVQSASLSKCSMSSKNLSMINFMLQFQGSGQKGV
ncbi:hypothetical protein OROGR_026278 [Orobanche gracilis]